MVFSLRRQAGKQNLRSSSTDALSESPHSTSKRVNTLFTGLKSASDEGTACVCSPSRRRTSEDSESIPSKRSSPSTLWKRQKSRSATKNSESSSQSSDNVALSVSPSAFGECFDSTFTFTAPEIPNQPPRDRDIFRVSDIDFDMLTPNAPSHRSPAATGVIPSVSGKHTEPDRAHEYNPPHKRPTRSQSRRKERSDSMHDDNPAITARDSSPRSYTQTKDKSLEVQPLATRSIPPQETPSFVTPTRPSNITAANPSARPSPTRTPSSPSLSFTLPSLKLNGKSKLQNPDPISPSPSSRSSSNSTIATNNDNNKNNSNTSKMVPCPPQVLVRPPIPDLTKPAPRRWESDLRASSLPTLPWGASKRWCCCNCGAHTIVEQAVCARLVCGHVRCEEGACKG